MEARSALPIDVNQCQSVFNPQGKPYARCPPRALPKESTSPRETVTASHPVATRYTHLCEEVNREVVVRVPEDTLLHQEHVAAGLLDLSHVV